MGPAPTDILAWTLGTGFWLIAINSIAMIAFHYDRRMAQSGGRRIAERTLLVIALMGGSVGALVARQRFRHKTRKQPFGARLQAIVALQVFALAGLGMFGVRQMVMRWPG